ncbi:MAG: DUF2335 domain-containing protein [Victivallaceae bacterium]
MDLSDEKATKKIMPLSPVSSALLDDKVVSVYSPNFPGGAMVTHSETRIQCGPLPPADELIKYGDILSDLPERILLMAEREQANAHENDRTTRELMQRESERADRKIENDRKNRILALWVALSIVFMIIAGAVSCAILNQPIPASVLGGGGLVMLVSIIIYGSRTRE